VKAKSRTREDGFRYEWNGGERDGFHMSGMGDDVGVGTGKGGLKWESGRGRLKQK
jgi:hypothetical protein